MQCFRKKIEDKRGYGQADQKTSLFVNVSYLSKA